MAASQHFRLEHKTAFPTVGEVLKSILKASGVWAYLKQKESLRKKLDRFACEESILRHSEIQSIVDEALSGLLPHEFHFETAQHVILRFIDYYQRQVKSEATCYGREESLTWLVSERALVPVVLLIKRIELCHMDEHMVYPRLYVPDRPYWYLPEYEKGQWIMSTRVAFLWWLDLVGLKSPKFAVNGDGRGGATPLFGKVSEDTMMNWLAKGLNPVKPDAGTLREIEKAQLNVEDEDNKKRSLILVMLTCNLVATFTRMVVAKIGNDRTAQVIAHFQKLSDAFDAKERIFFRECVTKSIPVHRGHETYINATPEEQLQLDRTVMVGMSGEEIRRFESVITKHLVSSAIAGELKLPATSSFMREAVLDEWKKGEQRRSHLEQLPNLWEAVFKGQKLLRRLKPCGGAVVDDAIKLDVQELDAHINAEPELEQQKYFIPYIRARIAFIAGDLVAAQTQYLDAFNLSRYCAGPRVLAIAEEYLSLLLHLRENAPKDVRPKMPMINYLFDWFEFMYPEHPYADQEHKDFNARAEQLYLKHFVLIPIPLSNGLKSLMSRLKVRKEPDPSMN